MIQFFISCHFYIFLLYIRIYWPTIQKLERGTILSQSITALSLRDLAVISTQQDTLALCRRNGEFLKRFTCRIKTAAVRSEQRALSQVTNQHQRTVWTCIGCYLNGKWWFIDSLSNMFFFPKFRPRHCCQMLSYSQAFGFLGGQNLGPAATVILASTSMSFTKPICSDSPCVEYEYFPFRSSWGQIAKCWVEDSTTEYRDRRFCVPLPSGTANWFPEKRPRSRRL